jgi:hypothetical protein
MRAGKKLAGVPRHVASDSFLNGLDPKARELFPVIRGAKDDPTIDRSIN